MNSEGFQGASIVGRRPLGRGHMIVVTLLIFFCFPFYFRKFSPRPVRLFWSTFYGEFFFSSQDETNKILSIFFLRLFWSLRLCRTSYKMVFVLLSLQPSLIFTFHLLPSPFLTVTPNTSSYKTVLVLLSLQPSCSYIFWIFFIFYFPRFTLPDYHSIPSPSSLPFLCWRHRTAT